ncbi:hypothetical protein ASPVEDRAFT_43415 [Aspergillus versicolor CBS 583.65]|uniref:Short-chain dehydrogenase/reductase family protein n=1 Tax=Aspergillus versicolor CBS 583.65 TaxID=1036611 RepID=A0A1L9PR83_ASPVE|nr:uncharacterized protein ASPVEDRAFT_43415 [Aspergillus versicolor CBS 583.65]OJJ03945.1 hypothetical protein ASPVEDRAFT_43415 [Aspergillus versicolor CBS 583.65]
MPSFLYSQLFVTPPLPSKSYADQVVIITGSNVGLGREAARHIARLGAHKVILAVRNVSAGETARQDIESSTGRPNAVEVWQLDLSDYDSVVSFAERAQSLPRLDAVIENAAMATPDFELAAGHERTITINVISTVLLAILLLPKLRQTARDYPTAPPPRLSVVVSEVHAWSKFPEWQSPRGIFPALDDEKTARMSERYPTSKLVLILALRELVSRMSGDGSVVVNMVNPGFCHSELVRNSSGLMRLQVNLLKMILARTTEVGSRTLVAGGYAGKESHGMYMTDGVVENDNLSAFVRSSDGMTAQKRVWNELADIVQEIKPGVMEYL